MSVPSTASLGLLLCAAIAAGDCAEAQSILVLNGTGTSTVSVPLTNAGFNVISGTLDPGQIAGPLSAPNDIVQIWIWNDGTFGTALSPADPARDFTLADLLALESFHGSHPHWIMDGLAWRAHASADEVNLTMNEALALAAHGGGIVLGTDDSSGDAVVQHVNQVTGRFNFTPFAGVFSSSSGSQHATGTLFSTPSPVALTGISSTTSHVDVPSGLQMGAQLFATVVFASPGVPDPAYTNPTLASEALSGTAYADVDHLITTTIPGAGFWVLVPFCFGDVAAGTCPCGNDGAPGHGCENSFMTGGALLSATGTARVSADDLTFHTSGMPPTAPALYFQGSTAPGGLQGIPFVDGIRCATGVVRRLGRKISVAGASSFGFSAGDTPISVGGQLPAGGGTRTYQVWYRNNMPWCTAHMLNLSNGLAVAWAP